MGALSFAVAETRFWEQPLASLDHGQWEALCDGCGLCCLHKLEDEDSGDFYLTDVACRLLDLVSGRCGRYGDRHRHVPDCITLSPGKLADYRWLPPTCAYRLRAAGRPLPDWHYLNSGDPEAVHRLGLSVRGRAVSELECDPGEDRIVAGPF